MIGFWDFVVLMVVLTYVGEWIGRICTAIGSRRS